MTEKEPTLDFVLKCNMTAHEVYLSTGPELRTIGDLRRVVCFIYDLPLDCMRLVHNGKTIHSYPANMSYPDDWLLSRLLRKSSEGDRIVFVLALYPKN